MENIDLSEVSADILCEFLDVAVHTILYTRQVYPSGVFLRKKKYNVPVQVAVHPDVASYIQKATDSLRPLLYKQDIEQVVLVILDGELSPVERFVFEIGASPPSAGSDHHLVYLEESLRSMLLKLNTSMAGLCKNPPGCTWALQAQTRPSRSAGFMQKNIDDFGWILVNKKQTELGCATLLPLQAVESSLMKVQLFAEENVSRKLP